MSRADFLIQDLPDPVSAARFLDEFTEKHPKHAARLEKKEGLFSDILTLVSYSPLLATTILQNPEYIWWLEPKRALSGVRDKEALTESLARFSMLNSLLDIQVLLSRFRRRELLRIFLRDIRRLTTIAEVTEEISNLADAILEYALAHASKEIEKRYGLPLETDKKGRSKTAGFCIVSLGKLGSKELNYSSDIDLLFIYSSEGKTAGRGTHDAVTNREYFVKLAERTVKIVGQQTGEGAAYRVDMRLRPHGRIGALALSLADTVRYYQTEARDWERQVLIRSRASAGDAELYKAFFAGVQDIVFSKEQTVEAALTNVRLSKEKIDLQQSGDEAFNVKLGKGGIREIEFIAQALQLAFGGRDPWLRVSHTLISLARLADRGLIKKTEITQLSSAYEFLRHLEHILQMEHGLQTHSVPHDARKTSFIAKKVQNRDDIAGFYEELSRHSENVHRIFMRIFGEKSETLSPQPELILPVPTLISAPDEETAVREKNEELLEKLSKPGILDTGLEIRPETRDALKKMIEIAPHFAEMTADMNLIDGLPTSGAGEYFRNDEEFDLWRPDKNRAGTYDFGTKLLHLRMEWRQFLLKIVMLDVLSEISRRDSKRLQTKLAELTIAAALSIVKTELGTRYSVEINELHLAIMGLGKLGGKGMDYGSDLDLVLVYNDEIPLPVEGVSHLEFYSRAVEIFVNVLSGMTAGGIIYRVDLRLRPYGKNGTSCISKNAFLEYLETKAAIWEWLAYVKIRGVAGDMALAFETETTARRIIHEKAHLAEPDALRTEAGKVRLQLEKERGQTRGREIDIKFGEGGMLDVYFLMRYLQLRDNVPDDPEDRSTTATLAKLRAAGSLSAGNYEGLAEGYAFLSNLDHDLRLTIGRSTRVPLGHKKVLETIAGRMDLTSPAELLERLTAYRINIRTVFDSIVWLK